MTHGIHLVWTTYGTWLPGDDRGHWSPLFTLYGSIRERGGQINVPDHFTRERTIESMTEPTKILDDIEQGIVADELGRHVGPPRCAAWSAAIETTHVHLLVGPIDEDVSRFVGRLKGRTSSEVGKLPSNRDRRRVWTGGFWRVFLFDEFSVLAVKGYIDDHNIRRGLAAEPYPWLTRYPNR